MKIILIAILSSLLSFSFCLAGEQPELNDQSDQVSYSLGHQIGSDLKQQKTEINQDLFLKGMEDALAEKEPKLSSEEMQTILVELKKEIMGSQKAEQAKRRADQQKKKEQYRGEGREFLAKNAKKEGVKTLPSGLQYRVIKEGTGKTPKAHDTVKVYYRGTLLNGTEFDSSLRPNEPATYRVDGVIRGWTEALQMMKEGAKWQLFIPADLAYGERGPLADRTVIYEIELVSVEKSNK